ncbi:Rv1733c family protein [Streptomyces sp. 2-6]|uniref:Rv1733c family protein n=1 Tax=Streptomyces sp. 2-6 TaxID=2978333 RepID=UPI003D0FD13F
MARRLLWRWRRNPLRRRDDVVEAWIVLAMWTAIVIGGALVGTVVGRAVDRDFAAQRADRRPVRAVLLADVPRTTSTGNDVYRALAKVRWTAPDGAVRTGRTLLTPGPKAGATVTVWQDGTGALTTEPAGTGEARAGSVFFGASAAMALAALVHGAAALPRRRLDRHRSERWAAEWELVGPRWDQKTG